MIALLLAFATAPAPQGATPVTTIGEFFTAGGFLMWPIFGCSVVVVGLAIERYLSLRISRVLSPSSRDLISQVLDGRIDDSLSSAEGVATPSSRVLLAGLRRRGMPLQDVEKAMEDQMQKETLRLRGNVRGISLMAAVAPLLGLLGTVVGIAEAFAVVETSGLGSAKNGESLAAGIKVALYTTIFGLCVAIPATLLAAHLQARVRRVVMAMAEALLPVTDRIAHAGGGRTHAA